MSYNTAQTIPSSFSAKSSRRLFRYNQDETDVSVDNTNRPAYTSFRSTNTSPRPPRPVEVGPLIVWFMNHTIEVRNVSKGYGFACWYYDHPTPLTYYTIKQRFW
jgi:hypothetical protein